MKDYKEKYEMALETVQEILDSGADSIKMSRLKLRLRSVFSELKESDEEIKEALIELVKCNEKGGYTLLNNVSTSSMLNWLEKQNKDNSQVILPSFTFDDILALQCCMEIVKKVQEDKDLYDKLNDLHSRLYDAYHSEKQGEQKPTNKVEPRFKVGDFIVNDYCRGKVVELTNDAYLLDTGQGIPFSCEHNIHLWDITKDAKDGDVLYSPKHDLLWIYKNKDEYHVASNGNFISVESLIEISSDVRPATKEQRDFLFQKMKVYGYEWHVDKKEIINTL